MKKRIIFLILLFICIWGGFLLQKPLFMLYNGAIGKEYLLQTSSGYCITEQASTPLRQAT